jgi:WD40 repeat protein
VNKGGISVKLELDKVVVRRDEAFSVEVLESVSNMGLQLTGQDSLDSQASGFSEASTSSSTSSCGAVSRGPHKCLAILRGQSLHVVALALSGEFLYSGSNKGEIRAWDHPDMQEGAKFGHGEAAVKCLVVVDKHIISAHQDHKIRVWRRSKSQPQEHRLVTTLPLVKDYIVNFLPSKNYVQVRPPSTLLPLPISISHASKSLLLLGDVLLLLQGAVEIDSCINDNRSRI